jgi:protein ImuA
MLSLVTDILPNAPGVRTATSARRVSHPTRVLGPNYDSPVVAPPLQAWGLDSSSRKSDCDSPADYTGDPVAWTPKNPRLAQLAEQIRQLRTRGRTPSSRCPSGLPELDAVLGGGFATAAVHELVTAKAGAAVHSVALRAATRAAGCNRWIFYIDTQRDLYPPGVAQLGIPLERLVVVRTAHPADALWVCEQTLRCRAVAAVVLPLRTIDAQASRRLQLAAEAGSSLGLLLRSDERGGHTFAASRLRVDPLVGESSIRRLLVTVLKMREGRPREPFVVELPDAADFVPAHAVPADGAGATRRRLGG